MLKLCYRPCDYSQITFKVINVRNWLWDKENVERNLVKFNGSRKICGNKVSLEEILSGYEL